MAGIGASGLVFGGPAAWGQSAPMFGGPGANANVQGWQNLQQMPPLASGVQMQNFAPPEEQAQEVVPQENIISVAMVYLQAYGMSFLIIPPLLCMGLQIAAVAMLVAIPLPYTSPDFQHRQWALPSALVILVVHWYGTFIQKKQVNQALLRANYAWIKNDKYHPEPQFTSFVYNKPVCCVFFVSTLLLSVACLFAGARLLVAVSQGIDEVVLNSAATVFILDFDTAFSKMVLPSFSYSKAEVTVEKGWQDKQLNDQVGTMTFVGIVPIGIAAALYFIPYWKLDWTAETSVI